MTRDTGPYTSSCTVNAWSFVDSAGEFAGRADHFIWVRPSIIPRVGTSWQVQVSTDGAANSPEIITIEQTEPPEPPAGSEVPRDGEYAGYIELVRAGDYQHDHPDDQVPLRIPVQAFVTDTSVDFVDDLKVISQNGKLRLQDSGYTYTTFFTPVDQGTLVPPDAVGQFPHAAGSATFPIVDPQAGTLTGTFHTSGIVDDLGSVSLSWRFQLVRVGDRTACTVDADCSAGYFCDLDLFVGDPSFGGCTGGSPWEPMGYSPVTLDHKKSDRWDAAIDGLLTTMDPLSEFRSLYLPIMIYDSFQGIARDQGNGGYARQIMGADILSLSGVPSLAGLSLAESDFVAYTDWVVAQQPGTLCWDGSLDMWISCSQMGTKWHDTATATAKDDLVPCINPTPIDAGTGAFGLLSTELSASCERVFDNYARTYAPLPSGLTLASFLSGQCRLTNDELVLTPSTAGAGGSMDRHRVYLCPYKEPLFASLNPATLAERMLCYQPGSKTLLLESSRLGQTVLEKSGDLACSDGRIPMGVDLITHADRVAAGATSVGAGDMLTRCLDDLSAEHSPLSTVFNQANAPQHFENLFSHDACFSPANFYGALAAVTTAWWPADPRIPKLYLRLLQQWLELHGYVAKQGQQQQGLANVLAVRNDIGVDEADAVSQTPGFEALLDQMEKGWNLLLEEASFRRLFVVPSDTLLAPDYRAAFLGSSPAAQPHHEQSAGLLVTMIETAALHLQLLEAYLQDALERSYADCFFGSDPGVAQIAADRASRTMRYLLTVEMIASTVRDRATAVSCDPAAMPSLCDAGLTCNSAGYCEHSDGSYQRAAHTWSDRWDSSLIEYQSIRARTLDSLRALQACVNPLEVAEQQVPLYFGDPNGDTARFFASSDYLLNGWAIPATQGAESALTEARTSWLSKRNSEIQQTQTQQDADRRLEGVSAQYGRTLIDACGLTTIEAKDALDAFGSDPGQLDPGTCYVNISDPTCLIDPARFQDVFVRMSDEIAQFQLCLWDQADKKIADLRYEVNSPRRDCLSVCELDYGGTLLDLLSCQNSCPKHKEVASVYLDALAAIEELGGAPSNFSLAEVIDDGWKVKVGVDTLPTQQLRDTSFKVGSAAPDLVDTARAACMELPVFNGQEYPLPEDRGPNLESRAHCFLGQLGEAALTIFAANSEVQIALTRWRTDQDNYGRRTEYCFTLQDGQDELRALNDTYKSDMDELEDRQSRASMLGNILGAVTSAVSTGVSIYMSGGKSLVEKTLIGGGLVGALAGGSASQNQKGSDLSIDMRRLQREFESEVQTVEDELALKRCFLEAGNLRNEIHNSAVAIERAVTSADINIARFANLLRTADQVITEGRAAVAREQGRTVPSIAHHYWLSEKIDRFQKDFKWAKRLVFLAMKAVEYEYQQTLSIREDIVTAVHPGQLEDAVRILQQEQFTRTINSRRPEQDILVLSLRDQIMRLADHSSSDPGERDWSPDVRFQQRLWSPDYAVHDDDGNYLGQGIPFAVAPVGPLPYRCAERLWSMTATIQGDLLGNRAPGAPVFIIRRNQFASQWCDNRGDDSSYQVASLLPASQLFHPEDRGGSEAAKLSHINAMLYPWFNIPRSEFYREAYVEGASDELAGRGLYGDYILLFPYHGLLEDGFPLEQIEDVLLRFDYLSVDNITGL